MSTTKITRLVSSRQAPTHSYYAVFIDYGRRGLEAIVDPEITRREVIARMVSGEYTDIAFIHYIHGTTCDDVTLELQLEASLMLEAA